VCPTTPDANGKPDTHGAQPASTGEYHIAPDARILIVRLSAIGDVVRTIPAVRALREALPKAVIGWAVEGKAANILQDSPYIDNIHILDRGAWRKNYMHPGPFLSFLRNIRRAGYDVALDFHGIAKSAAVTRMSGAATRIGFARGFCKEFNHLATNRHIVPPGLNINRYERNFCLVAPAVGPPPYRLDVDVPIGESVREEVDAFLDQWRDPDRPFVLVHPVTSRPFKVWPAENYAAVCDQLALAPEQCRVLITWGPGEENAARRVAEMTATHVAIAPPMTSLKHFAYMVGRADAYFGGDTGPMHIASTMGTPVAAIFGPTDPQVNGPYRKPNRVMYLGIDCSPCKERACERDHECMKGITPEQASHAVRELLATTPTLPNPDDP
jgi:heptosyltransferase-1